MHNIKNSFNTTSKESLKDDLKFSEIICPYSKKKLITHNCAKCEFCQQIKGTHKSGRSLTSLICMFGLEKDGELDDI